MQVLRVEFRYFDACDIELSSNSGPRVIHLISTTIK